MQRSDVAGHSLCARSISLYLGRCFARLHACFHGIRCRSASAGNLYVSVVSLGRYFACSQPLATRLAAASPVTPNSWAGRAHTIALTLNPSGSLAKNAAPYSVAALLARRTSLLIAARLLRFPSRRSSRSLRSRSLRHACNAGAPCVRFSVGRISRVSPRLRVAVLVVYACAFTILLVMPR